MCLKIIWFRKAIKETDKTKPVFWGEKSNNVNKPLARLAKKKKRTQIIYYRSEREEINTDPLNIKRIIKIMQNSMLTNLK